MTREEALAQNANAVALFNALTSGNSDTESLVDEAYANMLGLEGEFSNAATRKAFWVGQLESGALSADDFASEFLFLAENEPGQLTEEEQAYNTASVPTVAEASNGVAAQLEAEGRSIQDLTGEEVAEFAQSIRSSASAAGQAAAEAARGDSGQDDTDQEEEGQEDGGSDDAPAPSLPNVPPQPDLGPAELTLERALKGDLSGRYTISDDPSDVFDAGEFATLEDAAGKAETAYEILKGAEGAVDDEHLVNKFQTIFNYTVDASNQELKNAEIKVSEALAAFYATNTDAIVAALNGDTSEPVGFTIQDEMANFFEVFENNERTNEIEGDIAAMIGNAANVVVTDALTAAQAAALEGLEPGAEFTYTVEDAIENVFEAVDNQTTNVETIATFTGDVTLNGGSLDLSPAKVESNTTGATLDLSDMTVGGEVIVKLAELDGNNKGDLPKIEITDPKSDQTVKLPALDAIKGTLVIENMTIASKQAMSATSAEGWVAANSTDASTDYLAFADFNTAITDGDIIELTFKPMVDKVTESGKELGALETLTLKYATDSFKFVDADGADMKVAVAADLYASFADVDAASTFLDNLKVGDQDITQLHGAKDEDGTRVVKDGEVDLVSGEYLTFPRHDGLINTGTESTLTRGDELTVNDVLDFSATDALSLDSIEDAITSITVTAGEGQFVDLTIDLADAGELILKNFVGEQVLFNALSTEDSAVTTIDGAQDIIGTNEGVVGLIGMMVEDGTFTGIFALGGQP